MHCSINHPPTSDAPSVLSLYRDGDLKLLAALRKCITILELGNGERTHECSIVTPFDTTRQMGLVLYILDSLADYKSMTD